MRHLSSCFLLAVGLTACNGTPAADSAASRTPAANEVKTAAEDTPADLRDPETDSPMDNPSTTPPQGGYELLGILDPERDRMVAFALKKPRGWQAKQSFTRKWQGALPISQVYLQLSAPDGRSQIEYLPSTAYIYSDGPLSRNNRAMAQQMGLPTQTSDNELAPMPPVAYIRQVLLPQLAQHGLSLRDVGNEREAPQQRDQQGVKSRGSVDGSLPNGNRARVECRMSMQSQQLNGDTYYSWSVVPSITQSADDLEAAYAHTLVAQESIVPNPAWQQLEQQTQQRGMQTNSELSRQQHEATMGQINANTAAMTRAHEARMNNIAQQGAANTARYNERMAEMDRSHAAYNDRMASQDRQQEIRVDGIRGVSKYEDPTSGERVKVEDGYNHVYRDRQNPITYYGSNTPIEPGQVDWQELQRVSLRDY